MTFLLAVDKFRESVCCLVKKLPGLKSGSQCVREVSSSEINEYVYWFAPGAQAAPLIARRVAASWTKQEQGYSSNYLYSFYTQVYWISVIIILSACPCFTTFICEPLDIARRLPPTVPGHKRERPAPLPAISYGLDSNKEN